MISENTLMLYQQDLQRGPYFAKCQQVIYQGFPKFPANNFAKWLYWAKFLGLNFREFMVVVA